MKNLLPRLMLVAAFAASATLAEAQAVARGGGGGGSSSSGSSGSSGSSSSSGGGGGSTSSTSSSGGGSTYSAPEHSAPPRTPSGGGGGNRGGSASSGSSSSSGSRGNYGGTASRRPDGGSSTNATAPTYARPDSSAYAGRYAVPRQRTPGGRPPVYIYSPYYVVNPWGFGPFGYGYGLSYLYDPFYSGGYGYGGYGYPGGGGYGYSGGYGYPGGYGYYDGGGGGGYNTWESDSNSNSEERPAQDGPTGELRIKVKPREAKVMVDGTFMGTVDDFDGLFQKLPLAEGRHQVTLQLEGYQTITFDIVIMAGQTVNYKGDMHKLGDLKR